MPRQRLHKSLLSRAEVRALEAVENGQVRRALGRNGVLTCATVGSKALHSLRRDGLIKNGPYLMATIDSVREERAEFGPQ